MSHYAFLITRKPLLWLFCIALIVPFLNNAQPVVAQDQNQIQFGVEVGFDGSYRLKEWYPVHVTISNTGPDTQGTLHWYFDDNSPNFEYNLDLPSNSHKRVTLYAYNLTYKTQGTLSWIVDYKVVHWERISLQPIEDTVFLVGVLSQNANQLNYLENTALHTLNQNTPNKIAVRQLKLYDIPENAAALQGLDALVFHDIDTSGLNSKQQLALLNWVQSGGQLFISGGINAQASASGLAELMPVTLEPNLSKQSSAILSQWIGLEEAENLDLASNLVSAKPQTQSANALLHRQYLGLGVITYLAYDIAALDRWEHNTSLWRDLLIVLPKHHLAGNHRNSTSPPLTESLLGRVVNIPSAFQLLLFIVVYIASIGPINYLVLKRIRKPDLAWFTIPAITLLGVVIIYLLGLQIRGLQQINYYYSVVFGQESRNESFITSNIGIYSPSRDTYSAVFDDDTFVSPVKISGQQKSALLQQEHNIQINDIALDIGEIKTFVSEQASTLPLSIQTRIDPAQNTIHIQNSGSVDLKRAMLVSGRHFIELGDLAVGSSVSSSLTFNLRFPGELINNQSEEFNQLWLLRRSFPRGIVQWRNVDMNNANVQLPAGWPHAVFLLAWSDQQSANVSINNTRSQHIATSLYIIHLDQLTDIPFLPTSQYYSTP